MSLNLVNVLGSVQFSASNGLTVTQHVPHGATPSPESSLRILAAFCFPSIANPASTDSDRQPLTTCTPPCHHSFILTDDHGDRTYCACVTWWNPAPEGTGFHPEALCLTSRLPCPALLLRCISTLKPWRAGGPCAAEIDHLLSVPYPSSATALCFQLQGRQLCAKLPVELIAQQPALEVLLKSVDAVQLSQLLGALMIDRSVVIWSSQLEHLTLVGNSLLGLLWPLCWPHTYIPVVPLQLLPALGSPAPFVAGVPLSLRSLVDPRHLAPVLQLNLDTGTLWLPRHHPLPHAPRAALFEAEIRSIQRPQQLDHVQQRAPSGGAAFGVAAATLEWIAFLLELSSVNVLEVPVRGTDESRLMVDQQAYTRLWQERCAGSAGVVFMSQFSNSSLFQRWLQRNVSCSWNCTAAKLVGAVPRTSGPDNSHRSLRMSRHSWLKEAWAAPSSVTQHAPPVALRLQLVVQRWLNRPTAAGVLWIRMCRQCCILGPTAVQTAVGSHLSRLVPFTLEAKEEWQLLAEWVTGLTQEQTLQDCSWLSGCSVQSWSSLVAASGQGVLAAEDWEYRMAACRVDVATVDAVIQPHLQHFEDSDSDEELLNSEEPDFASDHEPECVVRTLYEHTAKITCIWGAGSRVLSGSANGDVWYHNVGVSACAAQRRQLCFPDMGGSPEGSEGVATCALAQHDGPVSHVEISENGALVSCGKDGYLFSHDLQSSDSEPAARLCVAINGAAEAVSCLRLVDSLAFCALSGGRMVLWDYRMAMCALTLAGHGSAAHTMTPIPNKMQLLAGCEDSTCRLWDLRKPDVVAALNGHSAGRLHLVSDRENSAITASSQEDHVCVWDLTRGECLQTIDTHPGGVSALSIRTCVDGSDKAPSVVTGGQDGSVMLWALEAHEATKQSLVLQHSRSRHSGPVSSVDCSSFGSVVSGGADGRLAVLNASEQSFSSVQAHRTQLSHLMLCNEGVDSIGMPLRIVSTTDDPEQAIIKVWDFNHE